jgi:translation initiation factor 1A
LLERQHRKNKYEGDKMNRPYNHGGRKPTSKVGEVITRVRTPDKGEGEVLGTVVKMLGASHFTIQCLDSMTRMCRLRGKMRKRVWIREGDTVIVVPWEFQDEKGDVTWRYTGPQVSWLRRKGYLDIVSILRA